MAEQKIGIGIMGANLGYGWAHQSHLPALAALPEYELAAVCTAHRETAQATAGQYDFKKAYWDYQAMVQDPAVQVVDVCIRVPMHYQIVKAALEAGKHVYCEWPLGRTTEEAEELAALARKQGVQTMVGLQGRGAPSIQRLRELIAEGYVGRVLAAHMVQFSPGILRPRPTRDAWGAPAEMGRNVLTIAGGHNLDAFCWCVGEFAELSACLSTQVKEWPLSDADQPAPVTAPDNVLVTGRLSNGAVASVHIGGIPWHGSTSRIEVYGTEGTIIASSDRSFQGAGVRLQGGRHDENGLTDLTVPERLRWVPTEVPSGSPFNVGQMLALLARCIRTGEKAQPDFTEAARRHRLLEAIRQASEGKGWVSLPASEG